MYTVVIGDAPHPLYSDRLLVLAGAGELGRRRAGHGQAARAGGRRAGAAGKWYWSVSVSANATIERIIAQIGSRYAAQRPSRQPSPSAIATAARTDHQPEPHWLHTNCHQQRHHTPFHITGIWRSAVHAGISGAEWRGCRERHLCTPTGTMGPLHGTFAVHCNVKLRMKGQHVLRYSHSFIYIVRHGRPQQLGNAARTRPLQRQ